MDGYLALAASRRAGVNRNSVKEKTNLLITPNRGNIVGEMSLRRLKAQNKTRSDRKEDPIRSISIGVEGESSIVHPHFNSTLAKELLRQE